MGIRFTKAAHAEYRYWQKSDRGKIERIKKLCENILESAYEGMGKPEPLKYDLQGYWSRRIDRTHCLVYKIDDEGILIISCRYHY